MLYANKTVGNTSYKLNKKSIKEQTMLQKNKDLLIEIATRDVKSVFAYFKTTRDGLSMKEAQKRIQVYGRNELTSKKSNSCRSNDEAWWHDSRFFKTTCV